MSYLDLSPIKRDKLVGEYQKSLNILRERHENRTHTRIFREKQLEKTFSPIIKSQQTMSDKIVHTLRENRESNVPIKLGIRKKQKLEKDDFGELANRYKNRYMSRDPSIDVSFGINFLLNGNPIIGNTAIKIDHNDIIIYDEVYDGTPGLWELLTEKDKEKLKSFTKDDLIEYAKIMIQTNVLYKDYNTKSHYPRSNPSWKWKNILGPIWKSMNEEEEEDDEEEEEEENEEEEEENEEKEE